MTGGAQVVAIIYPNHPEKSILRYLTPTEYERLMGLPEGWTAHGYDEKPLSDAARYRGLGNSIVLPCADFLMGRIAAVLRGKAA